MALGGAVLGGCIGLAVLDRFVLVAEDGSRLPGCGNSGMEPGALLGLILGAVVGVWISRPRTHA
jgi:hypothetical protein